MMYILTQEEYDKLIDNKKSIRLQNNKQLQNLCSHIARSMPIKRLWSPLISGRTADITPWGCIIPPDADVALEQKYSPEYCDECPVKDICPYEGKRLSQ